MDAAQLPPSSPVDPSESHGWSVLLAHPRVVLALMVGVFATASFVGAFLAYSDLGIINAHAYDLAIFQQALSSTAHGFHIPFFESSDCTAKSRCSLLLVHPSLVLYGLVPFYAAAPSALTLFAARSILVGAAAFPLYWLTRQVTGSPAKALLAAGLYLVWSPTMSGDFYSFHVESFLPLELFSLMALWQAGRYRWGFVVAAVSFVTLEVAPVFTFLIGVFFLVPVLAPLFRRAAASSRMPSPLSARIRAWSASVFDSIRTEWRKHDVRASLALMGVSLVAFFGLALFMNEYGSALLGVASPSAPGGLAGLFFENSAGPVASSAGSVFTSSSFGFTAEYWLILFALLGFLPLLSLRAWVLTLPWMALTFLSAGHRFSRLGSQYTMVALVPLFIGLAYGLAKVSWEDRAEPTLVPAGVVDPTSTGRSSDVVVTSRPPGRRWSREFGALVIGVVAVNLLLNPLCPILPATLGALPAPFSPDYFDNATSAGPGIGWVDQMVAIVPSEATVAVQNNLLPLLANDLDSYRLHRYNETQLGHLPFNVSGGPQYVLATPSTLNQAYCSAADTGCTNVSLELENASDYRLRAYVDTTPIGPVLLFEQRYAGSSELFGPVAVYRSSTFEVSHGLLPGGSGVVQPNGSGSTAPVIVSNSSATKLGLLAKSALGVVPPGTYRLRVSLELVAVNSSAPFQAVAVQFRLMGLQGLTWEINRTAGGTPLGIWTVVTYSVTLTQVGLNLQAQIAWQSFHYRLSVSSVSWGLG